ncbi:S4 domain-containing protein YaaA [Lentilactobacillus sp. SPB1-3]|uniref:S4 domain-containing protein YaaA n=1 Tax=Lentilactobacillus terminaliae TaxID=3003483 RepID=A0ACD5DEV2_9LACO|nr:S4 domain-containing protein YaaA [Lentilactobacillus sp. SPB1-3]MCZ0976303.1 S4 domain-containing protein YaaA [Lentilactobacillus sp. SPB1-3]
MKKEILIDDEYITLGQLLKEEAIISTGGQAKWYLRETAVDVNGEPENRRGKKLRDGDNVSVPDVGMFFIRSKQENE